MKKKSYLMLLSLILILPIMFSGCGKKKENEEPKVENKQPETENNNDNIDKSPSKVMKVVSDKMTEISTAMAKTISGVSSETTLSANIDNSIMPLASTTGAGWKKAKLDQYLWVNQTISMQIYAIEFLTKNATIENGYANGFEYGKVYGGPVDVYEYSGYLYIILSLQEDGVKADFDLLIDEETGLSMKITAFFEYDFENDEVKSLKFNFVVLPKVMQFWAVEMNFVNNSFSAYEFDNYYDPDADAQMIEKYNNGELDFDTLMSYKWTSAIICSGNITNNYNNLIFNAYEYFYDYQTNVASVVLKGIYTSLYNQLHTLKLKTVQDKIDYSKAVIANYIQDAVEYGENKAEFVSYTDYDNSRDYYLYTFVEYEDMIKHFAKIKEIIFANNSASQQIKDVITSANNYVTNRGESKYVGSLGTYGGITTVLHYSTKVDIDPQTGVYTIIPIYTITSGDRNIIMFTVENGEVSDVGFLTLTYKWLYDSLKNFNFTGDYLSWGTDFMSFMEDYKNGDSIFSHNKYKISYQDNRFLIYVDNDDTGLVLGLDIIDNQIVTNGYYYKSLN